MRFSPMGRNPHKYYSRLLTSSPCHAFFGSAASAVELMEYSLCVQGAVFRVLQHQRASHRVAIDEQGCKVVLADAESVEQLSDLPPYKLLCGQFDQASVRVARLLQPEHRSDFRCKFFRLDRRGREEWIARILKRGLAMHALDSARNTSEALSLFVPGTVEPRMLSLSSDPWVRSLARSHCAECRWFSVPRENVWIVPDTFRMEGEVLVFVGDIWPYQQRME